MQPLGKNAKINRYIKEINKQIRKLHIYVLLNAITCKFNIINSCLLHERTTYFPKEKEEEKKSFLMLINATKPWRKREKRFCSKRGWSWRHLVMKTKQAGDSNYTIYRPTPFYPIYIMDWIIQIISYEIPPKAKCIHNLKTVNKSFAKMKTKFGKIFNLFCAEQQSFRISYGSENWIELGVIIK